MQYIKNLFLLVLLLSASVHCQEQKAGIYLEEYRAFKNNPDTKTMFDREAHSGLQNIQRDLEVYKELSLGNRIHRLFRYLLDVVIVTPENMPQLYAYIDSVCKQQNFETPAVFIVTNPGFFNAFAQKLLMSTGSIAIGQKILLESSDKELEAVVAHELGHVKYNHVNKIFALKVGTWAATSLGLHYYINNYLIPNFEKEFKRNDVCLTNERIKELTRSLFTNTYIALGIYFLTNHLLPSLIINKRFEKEADEFAYKIMDQGDGLKEFFEHLIKKEQNRENEFPQTYDKIQKSEPFVSSFDYYRLMLRYYWAKGWHKIGTLDKWLYHNTPLGAHPSHEDRIKAIDEYKAGQAAIN